MLASVVGEDTATTVLEPTLRADSEFKVLSECSSSQLAGFLRIEKLHLAKIGTGIFHVRVPKIGYPILSKNCDAVANCSGVCMGCD